MKADAVKSELRSVLSLLLVAALTAMTTQAMAADPEPAAIVPRPMKVEWEKGQVQLDSATPIINSGGDGEVEAEMLASLLRPATGLPLRVRWPVKTDITHRNAVHLILDTDLEPALGKEGYRLEVQPPTLIYITAATPAGLFYGGQTLRQLLPSAIYAKTKQEGVKWTVPCCRIERTNRGFPGGGCCWTKDGTSSARISSSTTIDLLAVHKMNTLHWHLTEDQGWRIEIKKYPKLTEIGSWRNETEGDGKRYGGFYTQDDIREIVAYAAKRHVTIVPEIEMPGHSLARAHRLSAVLLHGRAVQGTHRLGRREGRSTARATTPRSTSSATF